MAEHGVWMHWHSVHRWQTGILEQLNSGVDKALLSVLASSILEVEDRAGDQHGGVHTRIGSVT